MNAATAINRDNVVYLAAAAAPRMNPWFRHVVAMSMVNPAATPDAVFCLADALAELADHTAAIADGAILSAALLDRAVTETRALAALCRLRGEQLAAA